MAICLWLRISGKFGFEFDLTCNNNNVFMKKSLNISTKIECAIKSVSNMQECFADNAIVALKLQKECSLSIFQGCHWDFILKYQDK